MIDDDLKICPFCKSRGATVVGSKKETIFYYILCVNQKCHVRTKNYRTREEAKTAWNRRVDESEEKDNMSKYNTAPEIEDKLIDLEYTNELCNRLFYSKNMIEKAIDFDKGVLREDKEFTEKLELVCKMLEELNDSALRSYGKEFRNFINDLSNRRLNE